MLSIKKSTRRPFSWSIARKLTISASARAEAGADGAALAGSACGFDGGGFWRVVSSRPIRTRTDSAKVASVRYGRKGSVAGATAAAFTARISRTPRIKATLIADPYLCCSLVRLNMSLATITGTQIENLEPAGSLDPSSPFRLRILNGSSCPIADLPARTGATGWKHDIPDFGHNVMPRIESNPLRA